MSQGIESDRTARDLRDSITRVDLEILELVNERLDLVRRLREHKLANGYPMIDPGREEWLINHLCEANDGTLSDAGVRALVERVIELGKLEVYGTDATQAE